MLREVPAMAANRIIRVTNNNHILPRCKSEGTLIDLSEGVTGASLNDVKGQCFCCHTSLTSLLLFRKDVLCKVQDSTISVMVKNWLIKFTQYLRNLNNLLF